ncbi:uncharacterized protein LOC133176029 isoform X2 [Saccostrea echinata]|uniref:uncharacterized protein LOC133176029 isoform X2 n=1 Tax=Saccostrea echinata TaxID=191078 RepID=UPI002A81CC74|nr:uncharacterized protein LOC133176029 isoform X2 [Saccostrea echinata]
MYNLQYHTMSRVWRAVNRLAGKFDRKAKGFKNGKGWPVYFVMPATFLGSFFIPKSFIQSLIKKRYGLMNDEDINEIPEETRTLLQEVLKDLKESEMNFPVKLLDYPSQDLALYKCKGDEIVIHRLVDIRSVALRVLIGIPPHLLNTTPGEQSIQNSPAFTGNPSETSFSSPSFMQPSSSLSQLKENESSDLLKNVNSPISSSKSTNSSIGTLKDSFVEKENYSQREVEQEESEKSEILDCLSDISRWEKKFVILREILLSRQHFREEAVFYIILIFFILSSYLAPLYYTLIYLNILTVNGLILKYHRCNGKVIRRRGHEQAFKILTSSELKNHSNYVMAGRKYCMRKLKQNCNMYKLQRRKAENSLKDKFQLLVNVAFHRFVPNCENVYNCAGGIRAWPVNYFNNDFFWAYRMQKHVKELNSITEK